MLSSHTQIAYLGIDVSKGYADFILLSATHEELEPGFQLDDTKEGHDVLAGLIAQFLARSEIDLIYCGVESTGGFELNWLNSLEKLKGIRAFLLNPAAVKFNHQASLSRGITDGLSAVHIAQYMIAHPEKLNDFHLDESLRALRSLYKSKQLLNKQRTQLINHLKQLLYMVFPEVLNYCKEGISKWVLNLLRRYPTVKRVSKARLESLARIPYLGEKRAAELHEKARISVASMSDPALEALIRLLAAQVLQIDQAIEGLKKKIEAAALESSVSREVRLLQTIQGVGLYTAACTMAEIEDIQRFPTPAKLVSYFGLNPRLKQSGDGRWKSRLSKQGRSSMRALLYMPARTATRFDDGFRELYHLSRQKGMNDSQAICVCMHKLLRVIWGVLASAKPYDPKVMQKHQKEYAQTDEQHREKNQMIQKRRFQQLRAEAPISKRNNRKRISLSGSQINNSDKHGITQKALNTNI